MYLGTRFRTLSTSESLSPVIRLDAQSATQVEGQIKHWAYNALDCTGTREVWDTLIDRVDPEVDRYYKFCLALQNPAMTMMRRGVRVNVPAKNAAIKELEKELADASSTVNTIPECADVWDGTELETGLCPANNGKRHRWPRGVPDTPARTCSLCGVSRIKRKPFNPQSPDQCKHLFYNLHAVPERRGKTGEVTIDEDALDTIKRTHPRLAPLCDAMLRVRDSKKQLGFLRAKLSNDQRWRQSVNVGAAWTGRFSSSKNPFGEGTNMANIGERHRYIFQADPGYEMFYADLSQAESRVVAYLSGDAGYIAAHHASDVHVYVARLVWPELPWTGDAAKDKHIGETLRPSWDDTEGHDYRFQAKRFQHGCNYGLSPHGISMVAHIPQKEAKRAYEQYHEAFPAIRAWHGVVRAAVKNSEPLTNPLGYRVRLFGRPWDEHTFKQGLAFIPQSTVAMVLNAAMWKVWKDMDPHDVQLLANIYDAILGQYRAGDRGRVVEGILDRLCLGIPINDITGQTRTCIIPADIKVGQNWGKYDKINNPGGLKKP